MIRLIVIALITLPAFVSGQGNLVPNSGFETMGSCPNDLGLWNLATGWNHANASTPDYFHTCSPPLVFGTDTFPNAGVPENYFGYQVPLMGDAYMGLYCIQSPGNNSREYIQSPLTETMVAGYRYLVSFHVSLSNDSRFAISTIGAHFSEQPLQSNSFTLFNVGTHIGANSHVPINDTADWVLVTDTFKSRFGGEQYITIGNFHPDGLSDTVTVNTEIPLGHRFSYYYIDDVSVIALDTLNSVAEAVQWRITAWPNPATASMQLQWPVPLQQGAHLRLYDAQGRTVLQRALPAGSTMAQLHVAHLPPGIYMAEVQQAGGAAMRERVVVVRE